MMRKTMLTLGLLLAGGVHAAGMAHAAGGLVLKPEQLPPQERLALERAIATDKAAHPGAFALVAKVKGCKAEGYRKNRNPMPECFRELKALGPGVVLPMLEVLAFADRPELAVTPAEKRALAVGLLRAVGVARLPVAAPVLREVFLTTADEVVRGEAAEAMGRLGSDAELKVLQAHTGDSLRWATLKGLGECMRLESAQTLAGLLAQQPGDAADVVRALGDVSSSWAWSAMERSGKATAAQGSAVRTVAAQALVKAVAWSTPEVREAIAQSLQMTEHPQTQQWLNDAQTSASPQLKSVYGTLAGKLQGK
jgi:hypothetical protein